MTLLPQNIRIALRGLRRAPAFAITAVLILGGGIGTAVAMSTVFRAVLLEQLPVRSVTPSVAHCPKPERGSLPARDRLT